MTNTRPFHRNQTVELIIHDLAFEGKGISRVDTAEGKYIVFVPNTIPGQRVMVRTIKVKKAYAETKLLKVLEPSEEEVPTPYHPIPGAPYITLPIERQHYYKRKTAIELFRRIAKVENSEELLDEFIPSPDIFHYRNKMEYSFSAVQYHPEEDQETDDFAMGFKKRGQWLSVVQMKKDSGLFDAHLENALPAISNYFKSRGFTAWHGLKHEGFCRFLTVKKSFKEDGLLINFVSTSSQLDQFDREEFIAFMKELLGDRLSGLLHSINDDIGDRPNTSDGKRSLLYGKEDLMERICGLDFRISLESFFQTNPASAERLYTKALSYVFEVEPGSKPVVLDLFSGTGTITQLLAQRNTDKEIIGVELIPEAVEDAKATAKLNGFENLKFFAADVGKFLLENPEYTDRIDTIVMDPPRAGIAPKTLRKVMRLRASRIVYISCNPATQARDMLALKEFGYELKKYSLVDQFPHTSHVESIALFTKENED